MTLRSRLRGRIVQAFLGTEAIKRKLHSVLRIMTGGGRRARLYYRVDDPYSHLLVQCVPRLVSDYGLSIELVVVPEPSAGANPAPDLLAAYAGRDAVVLADRYGLSFPSDWRIPPPDRVRRIQAVMLKARPADEQLTLARKLGEALWREDAETLARLVDRAGAVSGDQVRSLLDRNYKRLERAGHYNSAMIHYGGEWFWGIDRLHFLEARLKREGVGKDCPPLIEPRPLAEQSLLRSLRPLPTPIPFSVYFSFRSPYSYLAIAQLRDLKAQYPIDIVLKPVLPMVMRGLAVPRPKVLYIARDAKREADRLGIPFGRICDPLKGGIARSFAAYVRAAARGLELEFAESATRGIWAEARDMGSDADLRYVCDRAGLDWDDIREGLADDGWKALGKNNRAELMDLGLWGIPSFELDGYAAWGRDRLPILEERLQNLCKHSEDRVRPLRSDFRL